MAQTTAAIGASNMYVGFSVDGSTWVDASGHSNAVAVSGGERQVGQAITFDGEFPIVKYGKMSYLTITITGVYTETAAHLYTVAKTAYEAGSAFYVRWSPGGGDSGDLGYTSSAGTVLQPPYPVGSADTPDPILVEIVMSCARVTQAAIGTAGW